MRNIVLIGMPGSGKSTLGRALAERLGMRFVCTDEYVESRAGMTIPEIFARHGEERFREYEREAVAALTAQEGVVISTGGGAVLCERNRRLLAARGAVVWLRRDIDELARAGRPLSRDRDALVRMYAAREPLYAALADLEITVTGGVTELVDRLLAALPVP